MCTLHKVELAEGDLAAIGEAAVLRFLFMQQS